MLIIYLLNLTLLNKIIKHPHKKKWGQNFLIDTNIVNKIIKCIEPNLNDIILEIGPGDGALTEQLYKKVRNIHAVEIDPMLIQYLNRRKYPNVNLYNDDILTWNIKQLPKKIKVIGNLPYYISSPILFKLLQVKNWTKVLEGSFGKVKIEEVFIPSFDCRWNFASASHK